MMFDPLPVLPMLRLRFRTELLIDVPNFDQLPFVRSMRWRGGILQALEFLAAGDAPLSMPPPPWLPRRDLYDWFKNGVMVGGQNVLPEIVTAEVVPPGTVIKAGSIEQFEIALIGRSSDFASAVVDAVRDAAARGWKGANRARLLDVIAVADGIADRLVWDNRSGIFRTCPVIDSPPPPAPKAVRVYLRTPLRIPFSGASGKQRVMDKGFCAALFCDRLVARVNRLNGALVTETGEPHPGTVKDALEVIQDGTDWAHMQSYKSGTNGQEVKVSGLLGWVDVALLNSRIWPYLWMGTRTNVGKSAAYGLGRYELAVLD